MTEGPDDCYPNTVACFRGIGKLKALKVLRSGVEFSLALDQSKCFMLSCYGQSQCLSLTEARTATWTEKVGKRKYSAPELASLPPTDESFKQNMLRAHLQTAIWLNAFHLNPPSLQPTDYGWTKQENGLIPTTIGQDIEMAPRELLQLIKCSCKRELPCRTNRCSCRSSSMSCTILCFCKGTFENTPSLPDCDSDDDGQG